MEVGICFRGLPVPDIIPAFTSGVWRVESIASVSPPEIFPEVLASACKVHNSCVGVLLLDPPGRGAKFAAKFCH